MIVSDVIAHLRAYCPILTSVAGAAEYEAAETIANLPMPAAYVVPLAQDAGENESTNALWQRVVEKFAIVVAVDNRADQRGQATSTDAYSATTAALHAALLNWQMGSNSTRGLRYVGCSVVKQDRARAWYQWTYENEFVLDESDGFQVVGEPLVQINIDQSPYVPFEVDPPQP